MSIPVSLDDLTAAIGAYPWGYLVTVSDDLRAHSLAVPTDIRAGLLYADGGRSTRANIAARPGVTMVFPHPTPGEYTLIVDGSAQVTDVGTVEFVPSSAILHRPALANPLAG